MTIAAVFKCVDGLVICSDTEETAGDYAKVSRPKIVVHPPLHQSEVACRVVFASSGDATASDHMMQKLSKVVEAFKETDTITSMVGAIDDAVLQIGQNWALFDGNGRSLFTLLVALWAKNDKRMVLLRIDGNRVVQINSNYECVGYGVVLATYLAEKFYSLSVKTDVAAIALYIIEAVKTHVPYCGKQTHVLTLSKSSGEVSWHDRIDITGQSAIFTAFDAEVKNLLVQMLNPEVADDELEKVVLNFTSQLHSMRESYLTWRKIQIAAREKRWEEITKALSGETQEPTNRKESSA